MRKFLASVAIVFTLSGTALAQFSDDDVKKYMEAATQGDADAQNVLGMLYDVGNNVPQDYKEAAKWFRKAAKQGHSDAQLNLGYAHKNGDGVLQDYEEALNWFRTAAEQEHAFAQSTLGFMYEMGQGVLQDNASAHMWYNISGANGYELGAKNRDAIAEEMSQEAIEKAQAMARECMASDYQNCGY